MSRVIDILAIMEAESVLRRLSFPRAAPRLTSARGTAAFPRNWNTSNKKRSGGSEGDDDDGGDGVDVEFAVVVELTEESPEINLL